MAGTAADNVGVTQVTLGERSGGERDGERDERLDGERDRAAGGGERGDGDGAGRGGERGDGGADGDVRRERADGGDARRRRRGRRCRGSVTVTATAADNIGVIGVQFLVDGAPLGAEDTSGAVRGDVGHGGGGERAAHADGAGAGCGGQHDARGGRDGDGGQRAQPTGLVAAYGFNEGAGTTVADTSGNGNTGAISGATWTAAGRYGGALVFNGTSAVVTVANAASLQLTTGMTLEAWVYPTAAPTGWRAVITRTWTGTT